MGDTPTPDPATAVRAQAHAVKDALAPWHAGDDYYDFADIAAPASGCSRPRLLPPPAEIEAAYDPGQATISAHPVRPARP